MIYVVDHRGWNLRGFESLGKDRSGRNIWKMDRGGMPSG
jgi:hypothetical protein